ncbi:class I SAM-dependent methyltransferase [Streptomyces lydicus]|uniref:class I SAM-dependent methyltransferase n=1 Tax=Streptomyces lydicus TaxID=47763 RepID=UPI0037A8E80A
MTHASDFGKFGGSYAAYSSSGRGRLRHDLVARRVLDVLPRPRSRVLDLGCGDGEMVLRLAATGHDVTGADPSASMLEKAAKKLEAFPEMSERVRLLESDIASLPDDLGPFDAVCCHGVLMYLEDSADAIGHLARLVAPGGVLSVLTKNRLAMGVREALLGDYETARALIESGVETSLGNLGVTTRGDDPEHLNALARTYGLTPLAWQGVRIFHDHRNDWRPSEDEYHAALELEWTASWRSPYRDLGRLVHTVARREGSE